MSGNFSYIRNNSRNGTDLQNKELLILTDFPTRCKARRERPRKTTEAFLQVVPRLFSEQEADLFIHKNDTR